MIEVLFWLWASVSHAALPDELLRCGAIAEPGDRLACFDTLTAQVEVEIAAEGSTSEPAVPESPDGRAAIPAPAAASTPAATTAPAVNSMPQPQAEPPEDFGIPPSRQPKEPEVGEISATVAEVDRTPSGRLVIRLESDQLWLQEDNQKLMLRAGDQLLIRRGVGGAYYLSKASGSRGIRVERLE